MMLGTLILSAMSLLSAFVGLGHGYVRTIGLTDGLSSQAVYALHQDAQGYMWAGTYEGLNRLDGRHVKVYRAGRDGHDRISGDIVERVHETLPGVLWIHSNFGLDCLDTRTGRIAYHPALNGSYRSTTAPDGTVLATNADGRCLYYHYGRRQFVPTPLPGVCFDSIRGFAIDGLRRLVVTQPSRTDVFALSTSAGGTTRLRLVRRLRVAGTCLAYAADWDGVQQLVADTAYNIYERTATDLHLRRLCQARPTAPAAGRIGGLVRMGHTLLVAYKGRGVMAIDLRTGARQLLPVHEGVNALVPDRRQPLVWMATDGGLLQYVYDRYRFLPMSFGQSGWTGAAVRAIYIDPHGDLWLGTRGNGLLRYDGARTTDGPSARYTTANSMLGHDMVFNIVPSAHRRLLWIGAEGEGLNYYSYRLQRVCRLRPRQWPMVRCIHYVVETGPDELWAVSNWNGLLHIWLKDTAGEPEIVSCQQLLYDDRRPGFAQFFTIRQQGHELWLANRENGVYCLDTRRSLLTHVLFVRPRASAANDVHTLCTDIPGHVLVGTSAGLLDIVRGHGRRLHVRNLSRRAALEGQAVRAITADGAHGLWAATAHGHAELLWMLADALGSCYNTVVCRSAGTARQWLLRRQPQLVVVGAQRLDTDTVDFCRLLKGHRSTAHLPLVLLTSRDDTEADALAPITGADVRLTEPYDEADLLSVVSGLMQRAQVLKEYFETSASAFELVDGHVLHKDEKELLERIVAVINANITNPQLSTTFVARQLGIGTRNLYRQLAAFTHDTPTAIIRATRLERARRLLSHTTLTVEEIVYKAGFSNRSTFYTQFAQKFGCTPLEYQHRCREEGRRGMQDED